MKEFFRLLFAPCSEIGRHTSMAMDRELPRAHRIAIGVHYLYCVACRRYRRQIKLIREALRRLASDTLPEDALVDVSLPPAARDRIKRSLGDH
jgi:hypothetical protein